MNNNIHCFHLKITDRFAIKNRCLIFVPDNISMGVRVSIIFFLLLDGGRRGTIVGTLTIPAVMTARNLFKKKLQTTNFFYPKKIQNKIFENLKTSTCNPQTGNTSTGLLSNWSNVRYVEKNRNPKDRG